MKVIQTLPDKITGAASLEEAATLLGAELGLAGPAPLEAARRALNEPLYARALLALRKMPALRDQFLADPCEIRLSAAAPSSAAVVKQAAGSLLKWGMEGLKPAEPWVIERRIAACNSCKFQAPAPNTVIYRGVKVVVGKDAKICVSCNCLTNTKAAISTEHCPEKDPEDPGLSRWGDPWVPLKNHPKGPW